MFQSLKIKFGCVGNNFIGCKFYFTLFKNHYPFPMRILFHLHTDIFPHHNFMTPRSFLPHSKTSVLCFIKVLRWKTHVKFIRIILYKKYLNPVWRFSKPGTLLLLGKYPFCVDQGFINKRQTKRRKIFIKCIPPV